MGRRSSLHAHTTLMNNLGEVFRLLEIHTQVSGKGPGHKYKVEVLNKSALVLLVACWEAFVEDLAERAFSILLSRAKKHDVFADRVLAEASKPLREDKNQKAVWRLAGEGWRDVLKSHRKALFDQYIGKLNTPRPAQVDTLYNALLGIKLLSSNWHWKSMSSEKAISKLDRLVKLRGSIAHRVGAEQPVHKEAVRNYIDFVNRIAVKTSNTVRSMILRSTGSEPWPEFDYINIRNQK